MVDDPEKERKRKKQTKRMSKILATVWELDAQFLDAEEEEEDTAAAGERKNGGEGGRPAVCLADVGQRVDQGSFYKLGRHGWEAFSRDLGAVFQRHIQRYAVRSFVRSLACSEYCYSSNNQLTHTILAWMVYTTIGLDDDETHTRKINTQSAVHAALPVLLEKLNVRRQPKNI